MIVSSTRLRHARTLGAAAALLVLLAGFAHAGEPTIQVRATVEKVIRILQDPSLRGDSRRAERRAQLRGAIAPHFDFTDMARSALAAEWKKRTPQEQEEFTGLFSQLMERSYVGKIELYTDEVVRYVKEHVENGFARVDTVIVTKQGQEILILYRMHKVGNRWKVHDVVAEGVSLVNNYRHQFRSIIRRSSYEELVKILRAKRDEG